MLLRSDVIRNLVVMLCLMNLVGCSGWYIYPDGTMTNYSRAEAAERKYKSAQALGRSAELSRQMGYEQDAQWQSESESRLYKESTEDALWGIFEVLID